MSDNFFEDELLQAFPLPRIGSVVAFIEDISEVIPVGLGRDECSEGRLQLDFEDGRDAAFHLSTCTDMGQHVDALL